MKNQAVEHHEQPQPANLLSRIAQGDKQAERQLVDKYWRGVLFVLNKRTEDSALAADLAQDTFVVVIEHARAGTIQVPEALSSYIRQTAINLMLAYFRKIERRATQTDEDIQNYVADQAPSLTQALHSQKLFSLVKQIIVEMSNQRYQQILQHHFIFCRDKRQVCEHLEVTSEQFDRVLNRARDRLKELILKELKETGDYKNLLQLLIAIPMLSHLGSTDMNSNENKLNFLVGGNKSVHHLVTEPVKNLALSKGILSDNTEIREQANG